MRLPTGNWPAVGVCSRHRPHELSLRADQVEMYEEGPRGFVVVKGGPSLHGHVRVARSRPLSGHVPPAPEDRTEKQLERRAELGAALKRLAKEGNDG